MYGIPIFVTSFLVGSVLAALERDPKHIFARANCNADNCLRAINGTRRGSSFATAATQRCSAFLRTTVTPSPSTRIVSETTVVTLPTQYITVYVDVPTPVLVPSYASACSGPVRYASACSCAGITADATTLPQSYIEITYTNTIYQTPVTTLTITESVSSGSTSSSSYHYDSSSSYSYYSSTPSSYSSTPLPSSFSSTYSYDSSYSYSYYSSTPSSSFSTPSFSSSTPTPTRSCNTYELEATFQYSNFKDQVLEISQDYHFAHTLSFTSDNEPDSRFLFTLQPDGRIYGADGSGAWVAESPSTNSSLVYQVTPSSPLNEGRSPVICHLEGPTRAVLCTVGGVYTILQTCGYDNSRLAQGTGLGFQCTVVNLVAVPACT